MVQQQKKEKNRVDWSPRAKKQRQNILVFYSERNGSDTYSIKLDAEIRRIMEQFRSDPELGQLTKRKRIRRGVIAGRFAVFYRIKKDAIEVVAIVDARRNVPLD